MAIGKNPAFSFANFSMGGQFVRKILFDLKNPISLLNKNFETVVP